MLSLVSRKLRQFWTRVRWLLTWRRRRTKVVIRRFGKRSPKDRCEWKPGVRRSSMFLNGKLGYFSSYERSIRMATFNVAMFSLAPAVPTAEEPSSLGLEEDDCVMFKGFAAETRANSPNSYPRSILKQSPLHTSLRSPLSRSKLKVSINLPDNEISLAQSNFLRLVEEEREGSSAIIASRNYRSSVVMRSPVCFPANMAFLNSSEEGFKSSRSILEVLREVDADILALQDVKAVEEKGMKPLSDLASSLGMKYVFAESWAPEYGNAILSKWPIKRWKVQKIADDDDFRNVLRATVEVPWAGEVDFYCTQLDHLNETWRMKQVGAIIRANDAPHILAGGLNSLNGSDYTSDRWKEIVKYYEDLGKPTPKTEVMRFLKGKEYIDGKDFAGECEPVVIIAKGQNVQGTCKYGTRVDYILASPNAPYKFVPGSYSVISSKGTSDHHIVKVDITKVKEAVQRKTTSREGHKKRNVKVVRMTNPCSCVEAKHVDQ